MTMLPLPTMTLEMPAQPFLALRRRLRMEWRTITRCVSEARARAHNRHAARAAFLRRKASEKARMEMFIRCCAAEGRVTVREFF